MESLLLGEKEVVEKTFACLSTSGETGFVQGCFWMSNVRVLFEFLHGCFEENLQFVTVTGTMKLNERLCLLIGFQVADRSFQWKVDFGDDFRTREIFDRLTVLLDNLEQEG